MGSVHNKVLRFGKQRQMHFVFSFIRLQCFSSASGNLHISLSLHAMSELRKRTVAALRVGMTVAAVARKFDVTEVTLRVLQTGNPARSPAQPARS